MIEVATAINTFGQPPKADFVPSSEQLITLTFGQLQDLITQAAEKAIQPLQEQLETLQDMLSHQEQRIAVLEATVARQDEDIRLQSENCFIAMRLINQLQEATKKMPQPLQKDRGEILKALVAANGGKMLTMDARKKMHLSKQLFSMLLVSMKDCIEIKPLHTDKRKKILTLKPQN
jgi:hypothetical protein